ncbi:MAG: hypothetical protein QOI57_3071 [Rubrobacteraceae bacterium]|jgi:hypothetical protein|nr:hypothetical protein [Rubrobacteraceae bacterium]
MLLIAPEDPQALSLGLFNSYQERKLFQHLWWKE